MTEELLPSATGSVTQQSSRAQCEFARSIDSLAEIFAFVRSLLEAHGVGGADAYAIDMTIEELFTNMVKYNALGCGSIGLEIECNADAVNCRLTDPDSERFDMTQAPDVDIHQPVEQRRPGGLGIHLVRRMVDALNYDYAGRCSRISFRRTLVAAAAGKNLAAAGSTAGGSDEPGLI
jgi:serine/threonine-protein kinase RsbW